MNERMQERRRSLAPPVSRLCRFAFREPVTLPRKRIRGAGEASRRPRPVERAPVDLRAGNPKFRQPGKLFPLDESLDQGFPIGAGRRLGFRLLLSDAIAVTVSRLIAIFENLSEFLFQVFCA